MRFDSQQKMLASLALGAVLIWSAGCASTSPVSTPPAKSPAMVHAMVDMQKLLEAHPSRAKLRLMEQELAATEAKAADKTAELDAVRPEFEAAMKVRQDEDKAALEKKQTQVGDGLNEERRLYIATLDKEYSPLLFNIDLKLKAVQLSPTQMQALQKEKEQLEAQRKQKLTSKEEELAARFKSEMDAFATELSRQAEIYADKWMTERRQRMQNTAVSPEQEKQRQQIVELSGRMIQDVRDAATKIAVQEKIDMVWLRPAVHSSLKDITDVVAREIAKVK